MGSLVVAVLIIVILVSLFYRNNDGDEKEEKEKKVIARLKARYEAALQSNDKNNALKCGREYYAYLRNSRTLTTTDEEELSRAVADMQPDR